MLKKGISVSILSILLLCSIISANFVEMQVDVLSDPEIVLAAGVEFEELFDETIVEFEAVEVNAPVVELSEEVVPEIAVTEVEITEVQRPSVEEVLYHTWEESTDDTFEYEVWEEDISENMLAGAEEYFIDSYEFDENDNLIVYWHTDYMNARLIAYADREYRYMEANYFIEETNSYDSDTLYFRR